MPPDRERTSSRPATSYGASSRSPSTSQTKSAPRWFSLGPYIEDVVRSLAPPASSTAGTATR
jgi:hypothetical protein